MSTSELKPYEPVRSDGVSSADPNRPAYSNNGSNGAAFLAQASRLLSFAPGYEETLASVADLALPHLGSLYILDVVEPDGSFRRLGIVHPDPAKQGLVKKLKETWPHERDDPLGAGVRIAHGRVGPLRAERVGGGRTAMIRSAVPLRPA
ncbi:hypothetical protein BH23GEM6_BH23GEM6_07110 [soil metagenome]